ncbi:MAG: Crp/Fnr family transcriptional regulator [Marinilabiliales bacterium]|nr:MAG: Crp/Fnr family transcriptional regulator [Marinilabiliales bacterium]
MIDKFIEQLSKERDLTQEEIHYLQQHAIVLSFKNRQPILSDGTNVKSIYFVICGCVRLFYNIDGNEKTAFFYTDGDIIWADKNIQSKIPAQKNYQATEDTVIVEINKNVLFKLMQSSFNFSEIVRNYKEKELIACQQLIADFITLSPEERFLNLMQKNKLLFTKSPQQYIASYLGVSSETLSRIKKRVYDRQKHELQLEPC